MHFVNLYAQYLSIKSEIDTAIANVIRDSAFVRAPIVDQFEQEFAEKLQVKHCVSCANGTDAIYIAMKALGLQSGDEVITTAHSWIATSETITQAGGKVIFCDTEPDFFNIDPDQIEAKITPRTRGIIPVHLYGQPADMDPILAIARRHNLWVIEDCAQSHFSEFKGKRVGTFGIAASFSFYPGKNLGAYGDAGAIITNDAALAEKCKMYARHGALKKHEHQIEGINSRMDGLQAAILSSKLPYILKWTDLRIQCADLYDELLKNCEGVVIPRRRDSTKHTFHLYVIRAKNRDGLVNYLKEKQIETAIHYPTALPNLKAYSYLGNEPEDFPIATAYQEQILSLPIYPELSKEQIAYVSENIVSFYS